MKFSYLDIANPLISIFYPRVCHACGSYLKNHEEVICSGCDLRLPRTNFHLRQNNPIDRLFVGRADVYSSAARYIYHKEGNVQDLIHNFKYKGYSEIGVKVGKDYGHELMLSPVFRSADFIIPVPLHDKKLKLRGFNQSERFGFGLSLSMKAKLLTNVLVRNVESSTQTKKSRYERWQNVNSIFGINNPSILVGKHILLVDDVITTGSTIEGCINALNSIEDLKISVVAIASASH